MSEELREVIRMMQRVVLALQRQHQESQEVIYLLRLLVHKTHHPTCPAVVGINVKVS